MHIKMQYAIYVLCTRTSWCWTSINALSPMCPAFPLKTSWQQGDGGAVRRTKKGGAEAPPVFSIMLLNQSALFRHNNQRCFAERRTTETTAHQIPIAHSALINHLCYDPAVSSPEYYPTPASNADMIRKPLLVGRHLIILSRSGSNGSWQIFLSGFIVSSLCPNSPVS